MPITPGERLAGVLDGSQAPGAFSAQLSVPARDVWLTVAGAGPVSFPVNAPQAKRMIACARPVKHEIWKFGSPHTLVLTKTDELFRREAKARKDAAASLEWLAAQRKR